MAYCVCGSRVRLTGVLMGGLLLAGCAASDFATPVTAFSDATKVAAADFKNNRAVIEQIANGRRQKALNDGGTIRPKPGDCIVGAARCRLVIIDKNGMSLPLTVSLDRLQALMDGLVAYTDNLVAIVNADTAGALNKSTDAVKTNLASLAQSGQTLAGTLDIKGANFAGVTPYIGPVADAVNYGLGKALEAEKLAALRDATADMENIFPSLQLVFDAVSTQAKRIQINQLNAAYRVAYVNYLHNTGDAGRRDAYERAAEAYDAGLSADPKSLFDALREAHGALATALTSPSPNFDQLWTLLQRAIDEANKLAAINKEFQNARTASSQ
jgi:hypothetical protein